MSVVANLMSASVACSCPSEVVYQRLDDRLTFQQLQQLQRQEDQQPAQHLLQLGLANTYNAMGYDYLLSVSHPRLCQPSSNSTTCTPRCSRLSTGSCRPCSGRSAQAGLEWSIPESNPEPTTELQPRLYLITELCVCLSTFLVCRRGTCVTLLQPPMYLPGTCTGQPSRTW